MTLENQSLGLIGVGNMGTSIVEGLIGRKLASPEKIWVYDKMAEKSQAFAAQHHVNVAASNAALAECCGIVILAIKPQDLTAVAGEFREKLKPSQTVISILAGMTLAKLEEALGLKASVVRAMPNLGAKVGESLTALTGKSQLALSAAEAVFSGCGQTVRLGEEHFDFFTALAGSGPAYFFLLMETIEKKALEQGFPKAAARLVAVQTAVGASLLAGSSPASPAELREMVTSKGGTTEAALKILESKNAREMFSAAYDAAANRGRELRGG